MQRLKPRFPLTESLCRDILDIHIHKSISVESFDKTFTFPRGFDILITQTAEYALRAIVFLAARTEPATTSTIASETQLPASYLSKVMQSLCKAKLVKAQRGLHGGFTLQSQPAEITVLSVINAVEPIQRFHECPMGLHGKQLCPLHRKLDDAAKAIEDTFCGITIAGLIDVPKNRRPLCKPQETCTP